MSKIGLLFFVALILLGCSDETKSSGKKKLIQKNEAIDSLELKNSTSDLKVKTDSIMNSLGFVEITKLNPKIRVEVAYATMHNFTHIRLYDSIRTIYLREDVARRLSKSQDYLDSIKPGYTLLVYDGLRPVKIQQKMWDALDSIPTVRRGRFVSNPKHRSVHNYGAAVDLSICDATGSPLDMGAGYDDFRAIAFPSNEKKFLDSGDLTAEQLENRKLLRKIMRFSGFYGIQSEWWHFNAYSRRYCDSLFTPLQFESGKK